MAGHTTLTVGELAIITIPSRYKYPSRRGTCDKLGLTGHICML